MKQITILALILMVSVVSGISVGQVLTQGQINNANIKLKDLNPSWATRPNGNLLIDGCRSDYDVCFVHLDIGTTIEKQDNGNYKVISKTVPLMIHTTKYYKIAIENGREAAFNQLLEDLYPRAIRILKKERQSIEKYKTDDIAAMNAEFIQVVDGKSVKPISTE